jgi:glyoxylase-like metal-dependent hydrolase (beta-lactamase superfamily II)
LKDQLKCSARTQAFVNPTNGRLDACFLSCLEQEAAAARVLERPLQKAKLSGETAGCRAAVVPTGRDTDMTIRTATTAATLALVAAFACSAPALAQDLGPNVRKLADGVYAFVGENYNSNAGIVITQDGVVLIDSGHNPVESRKLMEVVKKLTPMPVRLLIDTEPHPDHTTGHFVFSPPATIVAAAGAGNSMRSREREAPQRIQQMAASSPAMKTALEGYRFVPPHVEYQQRASLAVGERTIELYYLRGVHSEADTAVWLPKERVIFSASGIVNNQINILRPFVTIPDILAAAKLMKGLNPEHVVPGHGQPGTVKIFEDTEKYYALLIERVSKAVKEGKSLDDIKKEVKMPEYASWASQDRFPTNIDAAYKMVTGK